MAKRSVPIGDEFPGPGFDADGEGNGARTLIERSYLLLREDIVEGRIAPGERLRVEHLKDRYGVGAGTLREAITRLVSDALVVAEGQRGFRASPLSIEDLQDLTALRLHIEIEELRMSIRCGDARWRAELASAHARLSEAGPPSLPGQRRAWEALNARFHDALISGHASPWTKKVLGLLACSGERYRCLAMNLPGSRRDVQGEHRQIYEAAMAGQDVRAALALEAHIRATPDLIVEAHRSGLIHFSSPPDKVNTDAGRRADRNPHQPGQAAGGASLPQRSDVPA